MIGFQCSKANRVTTSSKFTTTPLNLQLGITKSFLFAGQMVNVRTSNAFTALILIGCGVGMMPCSTNKIARIPFQCQFLAGFFLWSLRFHKFILVLVQNAFK